MTLVGVEGEGLLVPVGQGSELRQQAKRLALGGCGHSHLENVVRAHPQAVRFALTAGKINDRGKIASVGSAGFGQLAHDGTLGWDCVEDNGRLVRLGPSQAADLVG